MLGELQKDPWSHSLIDIAHLRMGILGIDRASSGKGSKATRATLREPGKWKGVVGRKRIVCKVSLTARLNSHEHFSQTSIAIARSIGKRPYISSISSKSINLRSKRNCSPESSPIIKVHSCNVLLLGIRCLSRPGITSKK